MKKILLLIALGFASTALGDHHTPSDLKKTPDIELEKSACNDPKNIVICEYSVPSPGPEECAQYRNKPKKFKFLDRQGSAAFGKERYCRLPGRRKK